MARPFVHDNRTLVPKVHAKWLHMLSNPTAQNAGTFTADGTPFVSARLANSPDTFNVGAALTLLSCGCGDKSWSIEAAYDYFWRPDNYSAHRAC